MGVTVVTRMEAALCDLLFWVFGVRCVLVAMDQDDQSLNDSVCNPVSKCAGVRDAKKLVHPGPMSPSLRGKSLGRERVS